MTIPYGMAGLSPSSFPTVPFPVAVPYFCSSPKPAEDFSLTKGPQLQQPQPLWHKSNLVQEKSLKVDLKQIKTHNKEKFHRKKQQENPQWSVNSYSYVKSDISKSFMLLKSNR